MQEKILDKRCFEEVSKLAQIDFVRGLINITQQKLLYNLEEFKMSLMIEQLYSWLCENQEITLDQYYCSIIYPLIMNKKIELVQFLKRSNGFMTVSDFAVKYIRSDVEDNGKEENELWK